MALPGDPSGVDLQGQGKTKGQQSSGTNYGKPTVSSGATTKAKPKPVAKAKPKAKPAASSTTAKPVSLVDGTGVSFEQFLNAIAQEESGGNYGAQGPMVKGDRAYGKYQIMGNNIPSWSKQVLGHSITVQQFMASPQLQEQIAQGILGGYFKKYGAAGAASAWFTGSPTAYQSDPSRSDGGTTASNYVNNVLRMAGGQPTTINGGTHNGAKVAGGGSVGTASSGTGAGMPGWDQKSFDAALSQAGFASGLIHSDATLLKVFNDAVKNKWDATEFQAAVQNTAWFKSRSSAQRSWDEIIYSDNAQAHRMLATSKAQIQAQAAQLGVQLTPVALEHITHVAVRNGLTSQEVQAMIGAQSKYKPDAAYGGTLGTSIDSLKQLSAQYNVPLSDALLQQFSQNIVSGKADITKYEEYVKQQAISKYPWLKDQIDAGFTVGQLADPYKNAMAQILEVDPMTIDLNDKTLLKGMQYMDPSMKGQYSTMPLWKFQDTLKQDPRWLKTSNARDSLMDVGTGVLRDMGLIF